MNTKNDGKLTKLIRIGCWVIGIPCLIGSAKLSVSGVGLGGDLWWMGWVLAAAFTLCQFIVNGSYEKELNWTILVLGVGSYVESMWMNILGIYNYQSPENTVINASYVFSHIDPGIFLLGLFIDAFPEMAIRWALGESRVGDMIGNMVKTAQNPEMLTKSLTTTAPDIKVTPRQDKPEERSVRHAQYRQPANAPGMMNSAPRPEHTKHQVGFVMPNKKEDDDE